MSRERSERIEITEATKRFADCKELMAYLCVGRNKALDIGRASGAYIKLGRRAIYDLSIIDRYIEAQRLEQNGG